MAETKQSTTIQPDELDVGEPGVRASVSINLGEETRYFGPLTDEYPPDQLNASTNALLYLVRSETLNQKEKWGKFASVSLYLLALFAVSTVISVFVRHWWPFSLVLGSSVFILLHGSVNFFSDFEFDDAYESLHKREASLYLSVAREVDKRSKILK